MSELLFETDWLGSRPVYYNEATGVASRNVNDVIEFADMELDPEGFNAYLGTGYSLFQHTPVRGVRFLPPSARLWRESGGDLRVERLPLDLDARLAERHTADEAVDLLRARVQAEEAAHDGEIVIPTSGGYDSRLINLMVADPSRVRSFSFGSSERQWDSTEVARARALAQLLGVRWEQVPLGRFHDYMDEWDDLFGPVVHAHGMYQMEFYKHVRAKVASGSLLFSGIFGDWIEGEDHDWAPPIHGRADVRLAAYTFQQRADIRMSRVPWRGTLCDEYYEANRESFGSPPRRVVEAIRTRMMILQYLIRLPESCGFAVATPFLDIDVATAMLTLPQESRKSRRWVVDYLRSRGAMLEDAGGDATYWLFWPAMRRQPLPPLDDELLAEVVRPDYVRWINRTVSWRGLWHEYYERLSRRHGFRRAAVRLRESGLRPRRLEAYFAYMTLRPIQRLLQKRDAARAGSSARVPVEPR